VRPICSDVSDGFPIGVKLVLVVSRAMLGLSMDIVIPKDILPIVVPCMIGILDSPSLLPPTSSSDLEVLDDINNYVSMTKYIPGNRTSFRGSFDLKGVTNYKRVMVHDSQHDVQIVFQIVPVVLCGHFLA